MRYVLCVVLLAASSECSAAVVGAYQNSVAMLAHDPVTPDSMFRARLFGSSSSGSVTLFDETMPFSALEGHTFTVPAPAFLTNGELNFITLGLTPTAGALDGFLNFGEDVIEYAYSPHEAIDFADVSQLEFVRVTLSNVGASPLGNQATVGATVGVEFEGASAVPEPASWVLCLVGVGLLWRFRR